MSFDVYQQNKSVVCVYDCEFNIIFIVLLYNCYKSITCTKSYIL